MITVNDNDIIATLEYLHPAGDLFEIRCIEPGKKSNPLIYSMMSRDPKRVPDELRKIRDGERLQVYVVLNEIQPECYAMKQCEHFEKNAATVSAKNILRYTKLFVDFDPDRLSGISATDEEKRAAQELCATVARFLGEHGIIDPLLTDSGNGYHLIYDVDFPATEENKELVKAFLAALDQTFSTAACHIDTGNFNPDRICKLTGTKAIKGADVKERPHRFSRMINGSKSHTVVKREQLQALVDLLKDPDDQVEKTGHAQDTYKGQKTALADFDLEAWLNVNGIDYDRREYTDYTRYFVECPFCGASDARVSVSKAGVLGYKCWHTSKPCLGAYHWRDYRLHYEPDAYDHMPRDQQAGAADPAEQTKGPAPRKLVSISAAELMDARLPEIFYPVQDLIPTGETVLAAPQKSGKSFLMLQLGLAVARGEQFLNYQTSKCEVVYLCLEDGDKFEQERLKIQLNGRKAPAGFHLIFDGVEKLENGFLQQLDGIMEDHPGVRVIIVDTLRFIAYDQKRNESAYQCDYRTGSELKRWADAHNLAVIVVTHTRKLQDPSDPFSNISGTIGVVAASDCNIVICRKEKMSKEAVLNYEGRRVRTNSCKVEFNAGVWSYVGENVPEDAEREAERKRLQEYQSSEIRKAVLAIAEDRVKGWRGRCGQLIKDALQLGVAVHADTLHVGKFLSVYAPYFYSEDGLEVQTISNGKGSNLYAFRRWGADPEEIPESIEDNQNKCAWCNTNH